MNELTQAQPATTHILIDYPKQGVTHLFRACDGMMIGMRIQTQVKWGLTPTETQTRVFLNEACAAFFLKDTAARADVVNVDSSLTDPIFEERDGEPRIEVPAPLLSKHRN